MLKKDFCVEKFRSVEGGRVDDVFENKIKRIDTGTYVYV